MEYKARQVALQGKHGGKVVGWVRPVLSEEEEALRASGRVLGSHR
jgi:hypothetical protein